MTSLTGVVLWAPTEVQQLDQTKNDAGWWIGAALKNTHAGDRLVVYQTTEDRGIVALFDAASESFRAGALGYAVYGRPIPLAEPIPLEQLDRDHVLGCVFGHRQGRFYLAPEQRRRFRSILPEVQRQQSLDPVPQRGDPDWEWRPMDRWWGIEIDASDAIAQHKRAWSLLGFAAAPQRERSPRASRARTDLKGENREGDGIIVEVKHFVAVRTLQGQLDRYLAEAREGGGRWAGHLLALSGYTREVARKVEARSDVALWLCERADNGDPELVHVAGPQHPDAR